MFYLGVLKKKKKKAAFLEGMVTVMYLPLSPSCVWFREVVLRLPLHDFRQSGFRSLVSIEADLRKVIHLHFSLL